MTQIFQQLQQHIHQRYAWQAGKSLWRIYQLEPDMFSPSPDLLEFVYAERQAIASTLRSTSARQALIQQCCELTKGFSQHKNQFITFSRHDDRQLAGIYKRFLTEVTLVLKTAHSKEQLEFLFRHTLKQHLLSLRGFTEAFLVHDAALPIHENFLFKEAVSSEYSASLQLSILGLDEGELKEPSLDIGCGEHGELVNYLRKKGYKAFGIDRACPSSDCFTRANWLELDLEPNYWGSILSHMAFSNHFLFHHQYKHGQPHKFAAKFMEILSALKTGGSFSYAPGLPFIETLLPAHQYSVRKIPVPVISLESSPNNPSPPGQTRVYATHIQKRS